MSVVSMLSTSPMKPRSGASGSSPGAANGQAWMKRPSWPSSPTARPPCRLMSEVSSWLSSLSAISTTVNVRSSVMRWPRWRFGSRPILRISASMRHPPPCTTIELHADEAKQCNVASEPRLERRIRHRPTTEADDDRLAVKRAKVGKRFGENAGFLGGSHGRSEMDAVNGYYLLAASGSKTPLTQPALHLVGQPTLRRRNDDLESCADGRFRAADSTGRRNRLMKSFSWCLVV